MAKAGVRSSHLPVRDGVRPDLHGPRNLWSATFYGGQVFGYPTPNNANRPPNCTLGNASAPYDYINGMGSDTLGNLLIPAVYGPGPSNGNTYTVTVLKRGTCGTVLGRISDPYGEIDDAASIDAVNSEIAVADQQNFTTGAGDLEVCTIAYGCGAPLSVNPSNPITGLGAGVALAKNGDCWLSTGPQGGGGFALYYWSGCTGTGQLATGTVNGSYGGLFIDQQGNLGAFDLYAATLDIYSGCNPACTLVNSFPLEGDSVFGGLNKGGTKLAVGDYSNSDVDVYRYTPASLTYLYSFNNSLTPSDVVETGILTPTNKQ